MASTFEFDLDYILGLLEKGFDVGRRIPLGCTSKITISPGGFAAIRAKQLCAVSDGLDPSDGRVALVANKRD